MGALVVLAAQAGSIEPGGVGECVVLIRNTADEDDRFDVLVHGPASVWATCEPSAVDVAPGEEATVWVRFRVPRDAAAEPGPVDFAVTVSSHNDAGFVHAERAEVVVAGQARLVAALDPLRVSRRRVVVPVRVSNDGTAPLLATVGARGQEGAKRLVVAPSTDTTVDLEIPLRRGLDRVTVDVVSASGDDVSLSATIPDDRRSLRRDLTRSAAVLGGFLVAAVLVVATIGEGDDDQSSLAVVAPSLTTTTAESQPEPSTVEPTAPASTSRAGEAKAAPAAPPDDLSALVFVRWYGPGDRDLVVRAAGRTGGELRLRSPGTTESAPDLSPDGQRVAYVQESGGAWSLCVAPATGGDAVCHGSVDATSRTAWRPDGQSVYAVRGNRLVEFLVDGGGGLEPVTHPVDVPGGYFSLSPDGTRVAVVESARIIVRPVAGGDAVSIRVPGPPEHPAWTAAGDRIIYTSNTQLFSAPLGDGPIHQLTASGTVNGDAVVTGRWVVFRSNRSGGGDLYAMSVDALDGSEAGLAMITRTGERDTDPAC